MADFHEERFVDARAFSPSAVVILCVSLALFACTGTIALLTLLQR